MGILEKIKDIEEEMKRTQKNKATEHHIGMLKAKLAKLRTQLLEPSSKGGKTGEGFEVTKHGDARISMIGFPSVGKSTFLSKVTKTESKSASYEFTTLTAIPGVLECNGTNIQLLDLPGIIEGASHGKGRGRQVIATAKSSDLILMVLDAGKWEIQRELLEIELYACGIRLNKQPPNISFTPKSSGGISITNTVALTKIDKEMVFSILKEYKIHNCDVIFHCDADVDDFIDVVEGKRAYIPCVYALNKIDHLYIEDLEELSLIPNTVVISCELGLNMDYLIECMWKRLNLVRVYTKPIGDNPNLTESVVLRKGATILDVCRSVHKDFENEFKFALVWGRSTKFNPQRVGLSHELLDEDVVQLNKK